MEGVGEEEFGEGGGASLGEGSSPSFTFVSTTFDDEERDEEEEVGEEDDDFEKIAFAAS